MKGLVAIMENTNITVDFFLGANSQNGFVSHFDELQNPDKGLFTYLIKGTPGGGKSSFMSRIALETQSKENLTELIHCSSDPTSLDGVILHSAAVSIVDATSPHTLENKYPLAADEVLNLMDCLQEKKPDMKNGKLRVELIAQTEVISYCHKHFCDLLGSINSLLDNNRSMILPFVDFPKILKAVSRIAQKEFSKKYLVENSLAISHGENRRMLSAVTPKGLISFEETVSRLCKRIYFINDEHRAYAPALLALLRDELICRGIGFYVCYSALKPKTEFDAILVPDYGIAFVTVNKFTPMIKLEPTKVINASRFIDPQIFRKKKSQLAFYKKTANELLNDGIEVLRQAKMEHDKLEEMYAQFIDFSKVNVKRDALLAKIKTIQS